MKSQIIQMLYRKLDELIFRHMETEFMSLKIILELEMDHVNRLIDSHKEAA